MERSEKNIERLLYDFLRKNSNCVDIGAHKGWFLKRYIQRTLERKHYAFEPLSEIANALNHRFPTVKVLKSISQKGMIIFILGI